MAETTKKFLDYEGLETLVGNIKSNYATKGEVSTLDAELTAAIATTNQTVQNLEDNLSGRLSQLSQKEDYDISALNTKIDNTKEDLETQINTKIASVYKFKGSVREFESLPTENNAVGDVYNVENSFTIGSLKYPAGTNVAWSEDKSTTPTSYFWDPLGGITQDLSSYATKTEVSAVSERVTKTESDIKDLQNAELKITGKQDIKVTTSETDSKTKELSVSLSHPITVMGISDTYGVGLLKNGDTIEQGTSLEAILRQILVKVMEPASATLPSINIGLTTSVNGTLKIVGSTQTLGTATMQKIAGHFNNDGWKTPAQPTAQYGWSSETLVAEASGSKPEGYTKVTAAGEGITLGTAVTGLGTNKVVVTGTANYSAPTNSPIKNDGTTSSKVGTTWSAGTASKTATLSWTGVYPCYHNSSNLGSNPSTQCTLQTSNVFIIQAIPSHNVSDFRFAYPTGYTVTKFEVLGLDGKYSEFKATYTKDAGTYTEAGVAGGTVYHYLSVNNGASTYRITLDHAMNTLA